MSLIAYLKECFNGTLINLKFRCKTKEDIMPQEVIEDFELPDDLDDSQEDLDDEVEEDAQEEDEIDTDDDNSEDIDPKSEIKHQAFAKLNRDLRTAKKDLKQRNQLIETFEKKVGMSLEDYIAEQQESKSTKAKKNPVQGVLENSRLKELEERLAKREEAETAREFVRGFAKKVGLSNEEYSILRENKTFTKVLKESLKLSNKKIAKTYLEAEGTKLVQKVRTQYASNLYGENRTPMIANKPISNKIQSKFSGFTSEEDYLENLEKNAKK
jgi:hypothetical protein